MKVLPKPRAGFTLIELLVGISIIGVVFGVVLTSTFGLQRKSRDTQRRSDLAKIQVALQQYYSDQNFYPTSPSDTMFSGSLTDCTGRPSPCTAGRIYLSDMPVDPDPSRSYCYRATRNASGGGCTNADGLTSCQYYTLSASLEEVTTTVTSGCTGTYTYQVNANN